MFRIFSIFLLLEWCVPIGKNHPLLRSKLVAGVERAIAKLTNQFCLRLDFFALIEKYSLDPVAVYPDANSNPEDYCDANKDVQKVHWCKITSCLLISWVGIVLIVATLIYRTFP